MHKGNSFSEKTLGKANFILKLTGPAIDWPANSNFWKVT